MKNIRHAGGNSPSGTAKRDRIISTLHVWVGAQARSGLAIAVCIVLAGGGMPATAAAQARIATERCAVFDGRQSCLASSMAAMTGADALADAAVPTTGGGATTAADEDGEVPPFVDGRDAIALGAASNALADGASALGAGSLALERDTTAVGRNAVAVGTSAVAIGGVATVYEYDAFGFIISSSEQATEATGIASTAIGGGAKAVDPLTTAVGTGTIAGGIQSTALGYHARTAQDAATAVGGLSQVSGFGGAALGYSANASGDFATAVGFGARGTGTGTVAMGDSSLASGADSVAIGGASRSTQGSINAATGLGGIALGAGAQSQSDYAIAIGYNSNVFPNQPGNTDAIVIGHSAGTFAPHTVALGGSALTMGDGSVSIGQESVTYAENSVAVGARAATSWFNGNNTAIGADAQTNGVDALAIGYGARVGDLIDDAWNRSPSSAVALGAYSYADRSNTVSVGNAQTGLTRQITNVAAGTEATDAVNLAQLDRVGAIASRLDRHLGFASGPSSGAGQIRYRGAGCLCRRQ